MKRTRLTYLYPLLLVCAMASILNSCTVSKSVSGRNISYLYSEIEDGLRVQIRVVNNGDHCRVFVRFEAQKLTHVFEEERPVVGYSIRYRLYDNYSAPIPVDSGNLVRKSIDVPTYHFLVDTFSIQLPEQKNYVLECRVKDHHSLQSQTLFVDIFGSRKFNPQSVVFSNSTEGVLYDPVLKGADSVYVSYVGEVKKLYVKYYRRDFPMASSPFAVVKPTPFDFTPDKVFELEAEASGLARMQVGAPGIYQVCDDTNSHLGSTLLYFSPFYPEAKTVLDLAMPLRYITTYDEFNQIIGGDNIKQGVDAYWLKLGGSVTRSRELIKAYYGRVQYANRYFTSYLEGWKSDRGMCYIVYGTPDAVYRNSGSETWIYGEAGKYNSLNLTFTKVMNPFTANDYRLNRSAMLKPSWYRAVEFWRQGRILNYK